MATAITLSNGVSHLYPAPSPSGDLTVTPSDDLTAHLLRSRHPPSSKPPPTPLEGPRRPAVRNRTGISVNGFYWEGGAVGRVPSAAEGGGVCACPGPAPPVVPAVGGPVAGWSRRWVVPKGVSLSLLVVLEVGEHPGGRAQAGGKHDDESHHTLLQAQRRQLRDPSTPTPPRSLTHRPGSRPVPEQSPRSPQAPPAAPAAPR